MNRFGLKDWLPGGGYNDAMAMRFRLLSAGASPAGAVSAMVFAWGQPCQASTCQVEITGAQSPAWHRAAGSLAGSDAFGDDCARMQLNVTMRGAHLTFITLDGRRAERTLDHPDELRPTVEALGVTLGPDDPSPPKSIRALRPVKDKSRTDVAPAQRQESSSVTEGSGVVFAVQGGTRGGAEALFSPVLAGTVSLVLGRWELGMLTAFEVQYFDLNETNAPSKREASAIGVGVKVGRREPAGSIVVFAGGRASIAALFHKTRQESLAETRLGAYLGTSFPRRAGTRFRAEIGADIVASGSSGEQAVSGPTNVPLADPPDNGSIAPWWAVSVLLGVEMGEP